MMTTEIHERLSMLTSEVERACGLLVSPLPGNLDECARILEDASTALAAIPAPVAAQAPLEARTLQAGIQKASALLEHAAEFHQNWRRIRGAMCSGYTPGGSAAETILPSRLSLEG